jgi:hypothetical protein
MNSPHALGPARPNLEQLGAPVGDKAGKVENTANPEQANARTSSEKRVMQVARTISVALGWQIELRPKRKAWQRKVKLYLVSSGIANHSGPGKPKVLE